ncbi:hypothetical protein CMV_012578 [Castanea mollissima]|uniref:Uncharacterized protein n=1 Tax=Castanea mollissima TaxID=60419 RepID=A0A8J4R9A4_9ROSI|nr:hypothetical protein CMV_012578 [Castanea mollissima]
MPLFQVIVESAKFDILLKVKRGSKEEKFKVEVRKNNEACLEPNAADRELGFMRPLWDYRWNKNSLYKMEHGGG